MPFFFRISKLNGQTPGPAHFGPAHNANSVSSLPRLLRQLRREPYPLPPTPGAMSPPAPHLVDEILEEIFLRLPTPSALARASTASPRFHRIITERTFLRRYRKLHPPPLLGFADENGFHPAQAPHPSAPLARALADAADFTYSFIPKPSKGHWRPREVREGRVLLEDNISCNNSMLKNLAVCDPLARRYILIPPIPEDLAVQEERLAEIHCMLAPICEDEDEDEDETSFKVICPAHYKSKLVAFVFSSVTGNWCIAASLTWSSLGTVRPEHTMADYNHLHGCFYWTELWSWRHKMLVLDTRSMEFSTINFLNGYHTQLMNQTGQSSCESSVVAARGDGALEMFSLVVDYQHTKGLSAVHHTIQQNNNESSMEWRLEKIISLPGLYYCFASGAAEGFLFLGATTFTEDELKMDYPFLSTDLEEHYFSLEVQTSETTGVFRKRAGTLFEGGNVHWYFGFPPSLSQPSI